jgi:hypothetical protein
MAKDKKKGKKKKDSAGPRDAVRGAVESTFQRAAGGASKAQELLDEIATNLKGLRDADLVGTLESVRDELQNLAKRVAALELRQTPDPPKPAATRRPAVRRAASRTTTARKPAARKPAARKASTTAAKPATARKPAAKKPAASTRSTTARKPAASRSTTARKPAASRSTTARKPAAPKKSS